MGGRARGCDERLRRRSSGPAAGIEGQYRQQQRGALRDRPVASPAQWLRSVGMSSVHRWTELIPTDRTNVGLGAVDRSQGVCGATDRSRAGVGQLTEVRVPAERPRPGHTSGAAVRTRRPSTYSTRSTQNPQNPKSPSNPKNPRSRSPKTNRTRPRTSHLKNPKNLKNPTRTHPCRTSPCCWSRCCASPCGRSRSL